LLRFKLAVAVSVCGIGMMVAGGSATEEKPEASAIYKKNCVMCHKVDGKGYSAMKTPDFTSKEWQANHKDDELIEAVTKGKSTMPAFENKLKADEIKLVIADVIRKFAK
jgi:mono/diheme cytochrome c family protein